MSRSILAALFLAHTTLARAAEQGGGLSETRRAVNTALEWVSMGIEVAGVAIILIGAIAATLIFLRGGLFREGWLDAFRSYRADLGRGILLGLELLVAADIIGTVAVTPSFENLAVLGLIVIIRTFLSFSLEVEIEGHWPWRRAQTDTARDKGSGGSERL